MTYKQTVAAENCANMAEIRHEIDALDQEVIRLLGLRFGYVKAAAPFKSTPDEVQARFNSMLAQRRQWAQACGLDGAVIENMYRDLVSWFIAQEMSHWSEQQTTSR
ncbi:isochorismate lyase [Gibbsiella dentisursi]|uniref:chorismate mutase n=1 Tax=Gibbsiella dentisursi TaxID=796890 RepID=A0ABP7KWQ0_9GAMM